MSPSDRNLNSFIAYRNVNANSNCAHEIENKKPNFCIPPFPITLKYGEKKRNVFFLFNVTGWF